MIQLKGYFLPNIEYYYLNVNPFRYPSFSESGTCYTKGLHNQSGTVSESGTITFNLFPTEYHIYIGKRKVENIYYKDLTLGEDDSTIDFGNRKCILSGTNWL